MGAATHEAVTTEWTAQTLRKRCIRDSTVCRPPHRIGSASRGAFSVVVGPYWESKAVDGHPGVLFSAYQWP